ncbi:MAG TPA: alpha/beta fold hydrolase, partial [Solirubrobacterales bacterium]|nr:alpha/beta fold hydrolase [Solirubrobacterales bacterium]
MAEPPVVDGVRHRWVEARGLQFHVAEAGEGDDVVLCLHGWPQHWYEWRDLMPRLAAAGHRAIAIDLRGFGWSDAPRDGYEKENLATDVLAVLDTLGHEQVKLVGHDWGGWIGFLLCLRAPERFSRYLSLNILTPWPNMRAFVPELWRFWYQLVIAAPVLGYQ